MSFEKADLIDLRKLGVSSLLDLALILPKYEDYGVTPEPVLNTNASVQVEIISQKTTTRILQIEAFCNEWSQNIAISIFNARPWHYSVFKRGKILYIHGRISEYGGLIRFNNPKVLKELGGIKAIFKLAVNDERIKELITKYINKENLKQIHLNNDEIGALLSIHKGDKNSANLIQNLQNNEKLIQILKFLEIYNYTRKLSTKKRYFQANAIRAYDISKWLENLPFSPTNDQLKAMEDIKGDLASQVAKKRVIMGDVGSGKTLVMLMAALMAKDNKSLIMAPTSILAEQIYNEAKRLLPADFKVLLVKSGDKNPPLNEATLIIGTHVLLYKDLPSAGLIMIDEQHRFGSAQRAQIERMCSDENGAHAHFLQFSATPIPRTLALINSNFVSYSFLKQMPFKKQIHTQIITDSAFSALLEHIQTQISQNKQVIIVYPRVEEKNNFLYASLDKAKDFWQKRFRRVFITHGKDKDKEEIIARFRDDGDILLSTTIIEVGISLPRLSTIVIVGAERFGLATLHQLRGRVGRQGGQGWCYLYTKLKSQNERLNGFCATLDGFEIAELDLQNRQGGDILDGHIQHGSVFNFYEFEEDLAKLASKRLDVV